MEHTHRKRGVAGGRPALWAVCLGAVWMLSCKPGELPCGDPAWKEICEGDGGGIDPGTGGRGGGGGGNMGGAGGVACTMYTSASEVAEKLIFPKCGGPMGMGCHNPASTISYEPKFRSVADIVPAVLDKTPALLCKDSKYVDKANPAKSFFVHKTKGTSTTVSCPGGASGGGSRMPFTMPALSQTEIDCLEWWAFEISK